ncbi:alpha-(1,3)-fucosyltransferase 7-like [Tachypleus tridentatus]|uniref:alpha-(1,3)-fucosyltransferase 7-like n=1 Tax=Tachypleus tridentatus TaxID=6853 RepID=UPI003FD3740A
MARWLRAPRSTLLHHILCFAVCLLLYHVALKYVWRNHNSPNNIKFRDRFSESLQVRSSFQEKRETNLDIQTRRNYSILFWKESKRMLRRFLRSYGSDDLDPFALCSVRNCYIETNNERGLMESDAVIFHLHRIGGPHKLPLRPRMYPPLQRWVFFTDESPLNTFFLTHEYQMRDYNGVFNWSMTYRRDSDVYVPYGRTILMSQDEQQLAQEGFRNRNFAADKTKFAAILISNCGGNNKRLQYLRELKKHIPLDTFGKCGESVCPGHFRMDCPLLRQYKFYLAFENSHCREYITEKLWWNAFQKEVVPVVMGALRDDYEELCPPHSIIHVDDFESPSLLAEYLIRVNGSDDIYNTFFRWKEKYKVVNEHGYFGSYSAHICRICEALNSPRNNENKVYDRLENFWSAKLDCFRPQWSISKNVN